MARIAIAGFLHETNTFAPDVTSLERFIEADAWPGLTTGTDIFGATHDMNLAVSGFIDEIDKDRHTLLPLLWCSANPSGRVQQVAFDTIVENIEDLLRQHNDLDAVFLDLHGAMVTEQHEDGEGVLLARLRALLGETIPIVLAIDFHANVTPAMVEHATAMLAYRTYPHVDIADTGRRAARFLDRLLSGASFFQASHRLPYLIPMPWQSTLASPMAELMPIARSLESDTVPEVQFIPGFPLADIYHSGPTVLVYAESQESADAAARILHSHALQAQSRFQGRLLSIEDMLDRIAGKPAEHVMILADTQDNPGGGGSGDTTDILHALSQRNVQDVCAGIVCDPVFAAVAHDSGIGNTFHHSLGGHSGIGAYGLSKDFEVVGLGDGHFTGTGPFYLGCQMDLGPMALVRTGGMDIVVSSRKQQAADMAMFRHVGAEPGHYRILVLKSSVHFRADFTAVADEILVIAAPGANIANLQDLRYTSLRPGVTLL